MNGRVLIIEDDAHIADILAFLLKDEGYTVHMASTGEEGLQVLGAQEIDLAILDVNLPGMDGLTVCNYIKKTTIIPVIILSCRDRDQDVIEGLEIGAEDYIKKPFNHKELILRVNKIIERNTSSDKRKEFSSGILQIDLEKKLVTKNGEPLHLTAIEFDVLTCLLVSSKWTVSWKEICRTVWGGADWVGGHELVKVNIRRLRKKLEPDPKHPQYIINEWGRGYRFQRNVTNL